MKAIEILYNLSPYQNFLEELCQKESKEKPDRLWTRSLKSEYNFITLELKYRKEADDSPQTAIEIKFEIKRDVVVLMSVYSEDPTKKEKTEQLIKDNKAIHEARWHTDPNNTWYHDEKITAYINLADEIADVSLNCSGGDNYYPGNFNTIAVDETGITLSQVNWHNAKSINHKNNYTMRDLQFFIPLAEVAQTKSSLDDVYQIGELCISFSDRSSPQNKTCGDKIVEQILQQQKSFEKSQE